MIVPFDIFVLISTCLALLTGTQALNSEDTPPQIHIRKGPSWKELNLNTSSKVSFYSDKGDDLFVSCQAPYPIQWNIEGTIAPPEVVKTQPGKRDLSTGTFIIKVIIFFLDAKLFPGLAASAVIACEKVENHQVRDEVSVYVKGSHPFVNQRIDTVTDSKLIPCPTTDPSTPTELFQKFSGENQILIQDVTYVPSRGFQSNNVFNGTYVCRKGSSSVVVTAYATEDTEFQFSPPSTTLRQFSDEFIEFKCSSKSKSVLFDFDNLSNAITDFHTNNTDKMKIVQIKSRNAPSNGSVTCMTEEREIIREWSYEFIEPPTLYVDNFEGEADCLSTDKPKKVETVRCKNDMDCRFMSDCLRNVSTCNFKKQKQFYADTDTYCWVEALKTGKPCVSVPFSHLNGIVQCTVLGLTRTWDFFISLDYQRYTNWKDAPKDALVRLQDLTTTDEKANVTHYLCTASAYIFADSLTFEVEYENATRTLMTETTNKNKERHNIDELNIKAELIIPTPTDIVAVHCIAPFWNTTETMNATINVKSGSPCRKAKSPDLLFEMQSNKSSTQNFYLGDENRRLICNVDTESNNVYEWQYANSVDHKLGSYKNVSVTFPELKVKVGENGESHLIFPKIEKKYSGSYQCVTTNTMGYPLAGTYTLEVSAEPMSGASKWYVGLVIGLLIVVALVGALVMAFIKKRGKN